jgi:hypothetical protein
VQSKAYKKFELLKAWVTNKPQNKKKRQAYLSVFFICVMFKAELCEENHPAEVTQSEH